MIGRPKKLPTPVRDPNGGWYVRWRYTVDGTEHRGRRNFRTEADANSFILRELVDASTLSPQDKAKTFEAYAEMWLESKRRKGLKPKTIVGYEDSLTYANGYFGAVPLTTITPTDADAFASWLCTQPRLKAARSVHGAWGTFRSVMKYAVRLKVITASPTDGTELPSLVTAEERQDTYHFLRPAEVVALAAECPAPYDLLVRFVAYTGLRRGEMTGLDVRHVVLTPPRQPNAEWSGYVRVEVNLKSRHSRRTVPLPGWLAGEMAAYLDRHPRRSDPQAPLWPTRKRGGYTHGNRTAAKAAHGAMTYESRMDASAFYRNVFVPATRAAGLEGVRFHDLRHTYASLLAAQGNRPEVVAKLMGHANANITLQIYTHLWPEHLDDAVATLAAPPPVQAPPVSAPDNVIPLRRRTA